MGMGFARTFLKAALIILVISLVVVTSSAQRPKVLAPHEPIAPRVPKDKELPLPPAKLGSVVGGSWMVDANFKSSIYIRNVVETQSVSVTPILYLSNGTKYSLPQVKLEPAGTAIVDVNAALDSLGLASYAILSGYVELQYNFPWYPICAFIRNVDTVHSMIFVQSVQVLPTELLAGASSQPVTKQQVLEGMWWKHEANVTGFVTLSNTSTRPIAASVQTSDSSGKTFANHNLTISANGTKIVQMTELASMSQTEGGVRVTYTGPQNALIVNGGLEDASVGYSANMHFLAAEANPKVDPLSVVELGLMTGVADPMMSFPAGTKFSPYSLLRNTSSLPATVTPTLWWMQAGSAQSSPLPTITLQPYQTHRLDVASMLSAAGLKNFNGSFNINFDIQGVYGAILQAAGSVDQTNTYVFEVNARGIGVSGSRSMPYWSTGNGDDTMVTIWNPADETQDFILKLFFTGGQYGLPITLGARATQTLNISEIIQNQVPDAQGNIIPASVHEGSAEIVGSLAENQMVLFAADLGIYNVKKAICTLPQCTVCNGVTTAAVAANPFAVPVGGQTQLNSTLTWNTGAQYNFTNSSNWSSNNTAVATVQTGLTHGVSTGSATVKAQVTSLQPVYAAQICSEGGTPNCPTGEPAPQSPGCSTSFSQDGSNSSIFVGSNSNLLEGNLFFFNVNPTGGTFSATSSKSSDIITTSSPVQGQEKAQVQTSTKSTTVGDRTLTFNYAAPNCTQVPAITASVTARQFAYLSNDSPPNNCGLGFGTDRTYTYTVFTEPDKTAVTSENNLTGTPVNESFTPTLTCTTITAPGGLNSNGQFTDHVSSACSSKALTCMQTSTQALTVAGVNVRSNTLQWTSTGVTYTSNGPTQ